MKILERMVSIRVQARELLRSLCYFTVFPNWGLRKFYVFPVDYRCEIMKKQLHIISGKSWINEQIPAIIDHLWNVCGQIGSRALLTCWSGIRWNKDKDHVCHEHTHTHTHTHTNWNEKHSLLISAIDLAGNSLLQQLLTAPAGLCQNDVSAWVAPAIFRFATDSKTVGFLNL